MPKLTIEQRTQGKAVAALLKLYKSEPGFMRELEELRTTYLPVLEQWLRLAVPNWVQMRKNLTQEELLIMRDSLLTVYQAILGSLVKKVAPFPSVPDPKPAEQLGELHEYIKSLTDLAYRWRLKATWAGHFLLYNHVLDMIPEEVRSAEIPIEMLEPLLPSEPLQLLSFKVNAYELMYSGRREIQGRFAKALANYENKLKSLGWQELPSAIKRHAYWWFEHYVHHKTYPELEQEERELWVGHESIKRAVWKFSKLLNIKIK